ncbi:MAG: 2-C-methyl-D-erythritol 2,4-cyclodiphosphate synthase [Candidatus Omnitrophica bacterium]|nr:2-C-methyl-D-erythritol 2,4-cyclodiphosphate synthase [Candidatus Omnitrophota bacterium]HOX53930.1 2-C-methyl-D-erythritol 2,4-cyclodiphosphate synthase [Candidatus Omnitrophota bacterium]
MQYKVGMGYDIHRLVENRKLKLGGIEIPYLKGLLGHSDGDSVLHAICDAILGAMAKGDIGEHFPVSDARYDNISSLELLKKVDELIKQNNYQIENIDIAVIAEEPILGPFKKQMVKKIAETLKIEEEKVNIKATTNEKLDAIGNCEAIAAYAVVLLSKV